MGELYYQYMTTVTRPTYSIIVLIGVRFVAYRPLFDHTSCHAGNDQRDASEAAPFTFYSTTPPSHAKVTIGWRGNQLFKF